MSTEQNTPRPKPHPFVPKDSKSSQQTSTTTDSAGTSSVPSPKKPFVRKPHLTERPFAQNSELKKLRESMPEKQNPRKRYNKKTK